MAEPPLPAANPVPHAAVGCTVCGCVCDDLRVVTAGGRVLHAERACHLADPWYRQQTGNQPAEAWVGDRPATLAEAVAAAAELLTAARRPLVFGLGRATLAGQRAALALADRLGAVLDTPGQHAATVALQQVGQSTCTLGEVKQRADLVVFWGCDPLTTHPRLLERSVPPTADLVAVGAAETPTSRRADRFVPVDAGRGWECLWHLRQLVAGLAPRPDADPGSDPQALRDLAGRMRAARFGVVFFGDRLAPGPLAHRTHEALFQLVTDLNRQARWYARRLAPGGNVGGADGPLAWQTGFPFAVDFSRGFPRYGPAEFSAPQLLAREEADCCLLVGSGPVADLPAAAVAHLGRVPVVALDPPGVAPPVPAAVRIAVAELGVHTPGAARRLDGVLIPLRPLLPTNLPADGVVLGAILAAVGTAPA